MIEDVQCDCGHSIFAHIRNKQHCLYDCNCIEYIANPEAKIKDGDDVVDNVSEDNSYESGNRKPGDYYDIDRSE